MVWDAHSCVSARVPSMRGPSRVTTSASNRRRWRKDYIPRGRAPDHVSSLSATSDSFLSSGVVDILQRYDFFLLPETLNRRQTSGFRFRGCAQ